LAEKFRPVEMHQTNADERQGSWTWEQRIAIFFFIIIIAQSSQVESVPHFRRRIVRRDRFLDPFC